MANLGGTAVAIPQIGEEYIPHGLYVAICRLGFGDTTETATYGSSGGLNRWTDTQETIPIFDINSTGIFVHSVTWDVETLWTTDVDISLGDSDDVDGYAKIAQIAATVVSTGAAWDDTSAADAYVKGRRYLSTQSIDAVVSGEEPLAGVLNVYCVYSYAPEYPAPDTGGSVNT